MLSDYEQHFLPFAEAASERRFFRGCSAGARLSNSDASVRKASSTFVEAFADVSRTVTPSSSPFSRASWEDFGRYAYQLNLPGSVSGSYSRNLNHLWAVGSVVALWDAAYVEFYYPALKEGETHLGLSRADAIDVLQKQTPETRRQLIEQAKRVNEELLCPQCLANYWRLVVHKMRDRFRLSEVLDTPKKLKEVIQKLNFTFFDQNTKQYTRRQLVAFHSSPKGTALHLITQKNQLWHLALAEVELQNKRRAPEPLTNSNWNDQRSSTHKKADEDVFVRSESSYMPLPHVPSALIRRQPAANARVRNNDDDGQYHDIF